MALDIIIPFYKQTELVKAQSMAFRLISEELVNLDVHVTIVNDSPQDESHNLALKGFKSDLESMNISCELIENEENLGFVKSANKGLLKALSKGCHALVLNSDAIFTKGAVTEMLSVLEIDEKIGFVAPRSNNASLASIPWYLEGEQCDEKLGYELFKITSAYLERYQIVPTVPGFCLLIKNSVLKLVGVFDEAFSPGYNEENDLIMRANRIGFICLLANKAWVFHGSSKSFEKKAIFLEKRHSQILRDRYPEYYPSIAKYFGSAQRTYERVASELLLSSHRPSVLLDLTCLKPFYNGTFELVKSLMKEIICSQSFNEKFKISILAEPEALKFHDLNDLTYLFPLADGFNWIKHAFAIVVSFAQPFNWIQTARIWQLGAYHMVYFLDNIATDCLYIDNENVRLKELWQFVGKHATSMAFLSKYARQNFYKRFNRALPQYDFVAMPSIDPLEYQFNAPPVKPQYVTQADYILVIGNHYEHKMVNPTIDHLAQEFSDQSFVAIGYRGDPPKNVVSVKAGLLPEGEIAWLYKNAKFIVFPSFYEGFGFPLIRSLAAGKRVISFGSEVVRELLEQLKGTGWDKNVFTVSDFSSMKLAVREILENRFVVSEKQDVTWRWKNTIETFENYIYKVCHDYELLSNTRDVLEDLANVISAHETLERSVIQTGHLFYDTLKSKAKSSLANYIRSSFRFLNQKNHQT